MISKPPEALSEPAADEAPVPGLRVLVVEDNVDSALLLAELLKIWKHRVQVAHDGLSGLALALGDPPPQVALIDISLPVLDGYELARRIRAAPGGDAIVLAALTGYGREEDRQRTRVAGFDCHFTKPVNMDDLSALLCRPPKNPV